jgi:hypothetical protein
LRFKRKARLRVIRLETLSNSLKELIYLSFKASLVIPVNLEKQIEDTNTKIKAKQKNWMIGKNPMLT